MTDGTLGGRHVIEQVLAVGVGGGSFEILFEVSDNSEEAGFTPAIGLAVEQQVLDLVGKFFKGRGQVDAISFGNQLQTMNQVLRSRARPEAAIEQGL